MKTALLVAVILGLIAAAAWALAGSSPTAAPYTVEVRDVAGVPSLTVVPEVVATVPGAGAMSEVVVRANQMPEVVALGTTLEVAGIADPGSEVLN